jgi:hypothetical protein
MLASIERLVREFVASDLIAEDVLYNEASLQHELALFLRPKLPYAWRLFLERPVASLRPIAARLTKKEIDIAVVDTKTNRVVAIELKCPRQGQHPEQMFKACQDLEFLEQLVHAGFAGGIFIMHVRDPLFYQRGSRGGIYAHFRAGAPICGTIRKPTGARDAIVSLSGSYAPAWTVAHGDHRVWMQSIAPAV